MKAGLSTSTSLLVQLPQGKICTRCLYQLQNRRLSTSRTLWGTRQRRLFFEWLEGPGKAFKDPLPNSTNYLNAYNKDGQILRTLGNKGQGRPESDDDGALDEDGQENELDESKSQDDDGNLTKRGIQAAGSRDRAEAAERASPGEVGLPPEEQNDLVPFPQNESYVSQRVLSDGSKNQIYRRVMEEGQDIRTVSASLNVEMRRVAAVVRLKAVEQDWVKKGRPLAMPYARAIEAMLPTSHLNTKSRYMHEPINDLPVHSATTLQIFHPTSESRHFARADAGRIFDPELLPADDRIPHPQLVEVAKMANEGMHKDQVAEAMRQKMAKEKERAKKRERSRQEKEALMTKKKETGRWEFRFKDMNAEEVGKDGRDRHGIGARYGLPLPDRKKGQVKIPRRVD